MRSRVPHVRARRTGGVADPERNARVCSDLPASASLHVRIVPRACLRCVRARVSRTCALIVCMYGYTSRVRVCPTELDCQAEAALATDRSAYFAHDVQLRAVRCSTELHSKVEMRARAIARPRLALGRADK